MIGVRLGVPGTARRLDPWTPARLSGVILWLRSDLGITLNGSNVSAWADQSGGARHAVQPTAGNQPPYSASGGTNNRPYITSVSASARGLFAGATADWPVLHSGAGVTVAAVFKNAAGPYGNYLFGTALNSGANRASSASQISAPNVRVSAGNGAAQVIVKDVACAQGSTRRLLWTYRTGVDPDLNVYVDGGAAQTANETAVPSAADPAFTLGVGFSGAGGFPTDTDWYEMLILNRVATADEIASIHAYLAARYT